MTILNHYFEKPGVLGFLFIIYLINPFDLGYLVGYLIFALLIFKGKFLKENFDLDTFILTLFSLIYAGFYALEPEFGLQFILIYGVFPPIFYLLGKLLCSKVSNENTLFKSLFFVGFFLSFSALVSVLFDIAQNGFGQINRSLPMLWSDDLVSATVMGSFFTLNMCIPAILIVHQIKLSAILRSLMILVFILSIMCVLRIGTRTQIVISLFTLFISLIYIVPRQSLKKNVLLFSSFAIGLFFIFQNVQIDLSSDVLSAFADRMDGSGSDIASGGGRSSRWIKSLENLFVKPLGWSVEEFGYSHNLWLDVLRASGVIPFVLIIIYFIRASLKIKRITSLNNQMLSFFNQIRMYCIALFLLFMVEPILEGMYPTFIVFCFLIGVITKFEYRYLKIQKETKKPI